MKTAKQELLEVLERMPDDAPMDSLLAQMEFKASVMRGLEQAQRGEGSSDEELESEITQLRFKASVLRGLADLARGDVISHEQLEERLAHWRESSGRKKLSET